MTMYLFFVFCCWFLNMSCRKIHRALEMWIWHMQFVSGLTFDSQMWPCGGGKSSCFRNDEWMNTIFVHCLGMVYNATIGHREMYSWWIPQVDVNCNRHSSEKQLRKFCIIKTIRCWLPHRRHTLQCNWRKAVWRVLRQRRQVTSLFIHSLSFLSIMHCLALPDTASLTSIYIYIYNAWMKLMFDGNNVIVHGCSYIAET